VSSVAGFEAVERRTRSFAHSLGPTRRMVNIPSLSFFFVPPPLSFFLCFVLSF
jgi:hypothetical protein